MRWTLFEEEGRSAGYLGFGAFHERETLSSQTGTTDSLRSRLWRGNSYLILPIDVSGLYYNAQAINREGPGDTGIGALDIIDWSVEVRLTQ